MARMAGLNHFAIMVSDLERSRHFYCDQLGLPIAEFAEHRDGPISDCMAVPHVFMKEYRLGVPAILGYGEAKAPFALTFDIIQWTSPVGEVKRPTINDVPSAHVCFTVRDLAATYNDLKGKGVDFLSPPVRFPEEEGSWHVVFLRDPDGFVIELLEAKADWVGVVP